jgi:hypothetical protein
MALLSLVAFHSIKMVDTARSSHSRRAHTLHTAHRKSNTLKCHRRTTTLIKKLKKIKRPIRSIGRAWLKVKMLGNTIVS